VSAAAFLDDGFSFKGVTYRPLTARTLLLLERAKSPFFTGEDAGARGLLDFLFVSSRDSAAVLPLLRESDAWDLAVLDFADQFTAADLEELGRLVAEGNEHVAASIVEAQPEKGARKKPRQTSHSGPQT
jgi:hypothetical protein